MGWKHGEGDEEPGGRRFLPHTGRFWAKSQLTALLLHAEREVHPLNSRRYSQSPGCLYLAAKLHVFGHVTHQKPSGRCKPTACCFFSSGPHLLATDTQSPASHLSCPCGLASSLRPHAYAEHTADQLFLNRACIPRGAVPSHEALVKVVVNYFFL